MTAIDILSWNILHGGGQRLQKILEATQAIDPDIVTFCEFKNHAAGMLLLDTLQSSGYSFISSTQSHPSENGIFIASKMPGEFSVFLNADPRFPHSIIKISLESFDLYSVYFPHKKDHTLFDFFQQRLRSSDKPVIITGDLNTGINGIDQKGKSFMYENEYKNLLKLGMKDGFRHLHGNKETYSWYSHHGNGFRYDHTLISEQLIPQLKAFEYLDVLRQQKLSDHAPMYLVMGI